MNDEEIIFQDKTFVFTGEMNIPRDEAKSKVILLGGRCTTVPSGKTNYLVCGTEPGISKLKKAKELNIKMIYQEEFISSLERSLRRANKTITVDLPPNKTEGGMCKGDNENLKEIKDVRRLTTVTDNMWSEKYRPKCRQDLIGNSTIISSLADFLKGKTKFKAALLSGQPGTGKTTSAHVVCKELNFNIIEFNASDIRNKGSLVTHVKGFINTLSISNNLKMNRKVVIMDEVDGMSSDRGGLLELTSIIKTSSVPIICICNDRNDQKIRTLSNYCLDLRFRKLDAKHILPRIKKILKAENKHIDDNILNEIISVGHGDVRYILNTLQNLCMRKTINIQVASNIMRKVMAKNTFEIAAEVFHRKNISDKIDLYFEDYSIIPLFVQENYLKMSFKNLKEMYDSSESISRGDIVEKMIRGANQEWSLAPLHGFVSVVVPTHNKFLNKRMDFPLWLGQNSKQNKHLRYIQEIKTHASTHISSGTYSFRLYDALLIYNEFITSLSKDNVQDVINQLIELDLVKDDLLNLSEVIINGIQNFKEIKTKTKSELTRMYKKIKRNLPYTEEENIVEVITDD